MKKKIGILTFQRTANYGAQLQNYALQEYLQNKNDCEVEVIDYQNKRINQTEKPTSFFKKKGLKEFIKYFKCNKYHVNKWKKFENFRKENIQYSPKCDKNNISSICSLYNGIIVGSDQIWNTDITGKDYTYFLDFEKDSNKKYSYAASFGFSKLPTNEAEKIIKLVNEFSFINLREKSALNMLPKTNKTKEFVLDPTFLLDKESWINKMKLQKKREKDYIFVYMIDENVENLTRIYELANREKLDIIHVRDGFRELKNIKSVRDASPIEFLNLLYNAKYTVVGSFHGLCLSIIFEKDFYYVLNNKYNRNSRLIDLVNIVGLQNREDFSNKNRINYKEVHKKIEKEIDKSKQILNDMVKKINEK